MAASEILARAVRQRILPKLQAAAPERTGDLKRGLRVRALGDRAVVVGVLYPPYTQGRNTAHPGVYGYIHHQIEENRTGTSRGWFEKTIHDNIAATIKSVLPELVADYLGQRR